MKGLGWLSEQGETGGSGDPGIISDGNGDSGGISYGKYQFASNTGAVSAFINWLKSHLPPYNTYGEELAQFEINSEEFQSKWKEIANIDSEGFSALQDEYCKPQYYDAGSDELLNQYGFDISNKSFALKSVLFSNCIQHGPTYGAEVFQDASNLIGKNINDMSDEELIQNIYEVKLTDPSWSSGAPSQRQGLFDRWNRERDIALDMLKNDETGLE